MTIDDSPMPDDVLEIVDRPGETTRTTASLLASLLARAATLHAVTGSQAMASISAGLCRLGREFGETIEGRRVRDALVGARPGINMALLFDELGFGAVATESSPTPLLQDFHNDLALLLAADLAPVIEQSKLGANPNTGIGPLEPGEPIEPIDFVVGLWAFSTEVVGAIETLVDDLGEPTVIVEPAQDREPSVGRILR